MRPAKILRGRAFLADRKTRRQFGLLLVSHNARMRRRAELPNALRRVCAKRPGPVTRPQWRRRSSDFRAGLIDWPAPRQG